MRTKYTAERDSIKVKESGVIWNKDSIGYLALFSPAIICLVLSLIFGFTTDGEYAGTYAVSWSAGLFYFFTGAALFLLMMIFWDSMSLPKVFNFKKPKNINVRNLRPDYLSDDIYKEAYNDCIEEIKAGTFDERFWTTTFFNLDTEKEQTDRIIKEKLAEEIKAIPRKNYTEWMKERNQMFLEQYK